MYPIDDAEVVSSNSLFDRYKNYVDQLFIYNFYQHGSLPYTFSTCLILQRGST